MARRVILKLQLAWLSLALMGCGVIDAVTLIPEGDLLPPAHLELNDPSLPFGHSWLDPSRRFRHYDMISILPVRVSENIGENWLDSSSMFISSEDQYRRNVRRLADYATTELRKVFQEKNDANRFILIDYPRRGALTIEMRITEVVFAEPVFHAFSTALPVPAGSQLLSTVRNPIVGMELIVRDGDSGETLATFADKGSAPVRIVDLRKFFVAGANREIVTDWAIRIRDTLNREDRRERIRRRFPFSLLPF